MSVEDMAGPMLARTVVESRLAEAEASNSKLSDQAKTLEVEITEQREAQSEIYFYLHKKLDDNYEAIARLEGQSTETSAKARGETAAHEASLSGLNRERAETQIALARQLNTLMSEVATLEDFAARRDSLTTIVTTLDGNLTAAQERHRSDGEQKVADAEKEKDHLREALRMDLDRTRNESIATMESKLTPVRVSRGKKTTTTNAGRSLVFSPPPPPSTRRPSAQQWRTRE